MQTDGHPPAWAGRLLALLALSVAVLILSPGSLLGDPPDEDDAPPPPLPETFVSAEAEAAAAVAAVHPVLREARALQDKMPQNVASNMHFAFTPEHFQRYADSVSYRRGEAEDALESHRDGHLTEVELAVKLAELELRAYETVFEAIRDRMQLDGAMLAATSGATDWAVGSWYPDRPEADIEKEKRQLTAFIELAQAVVAVRQRVEQQRSDLRVKMMRIARRVEEHDETAAARMVEAIDRKFRESYFDGSVERHLLGEFNHALMRCHVWGGRSQYNVHYIDAFTAPNLLARARLRQQLIEDGRVPRRRMSVSLGDAHGNERTGRVVSPGMTFEAVMEAEGCLLTRQTLRLEHYRDGQPVSFGSLPLLYMDPQRAEDQGHARRIGLRGQVHTESLYLSNKMMLITEDQQDSQAVRIARANEWFTMVVQPGDVIRIVNGWGGVVTLGVEPAQPKLQLIDVETDEVVALEEMRYGVSYHLQLILSERHPTSDLYYQVAWGEGRFQNKDILMMAEVSENPEVAAMQRRAGYTQFRSARPMVFDDSSLPAHPRGER